MFWVDRYSFSLKWTFRFIDYPWASWFCLGRTCFKHNCLISMVLYGTSVTIRIISFPLLIAFLLKHSRENKILWSCFRIEFLIKTRFWLFRCMPRSHLLVMLSKTNYFSDILLWSWIIWQTPVFFKVES